MTKKITSIVGGIGFGYLFYDQQLGLNAVLYSILLITILFINYTERLKSISALLSGVFLLLSSIGIAISGQNLSIVAYLVSFPVFVSCILHEGISKVFAFRIGFFNTVLSFLFQKSDKSIPKKKSSVTSRNVAPILIATGVALVFFLLYANANPVIAWLQGKIDLSNLNFVFILISILGTILTYNSTQQNIDTESIQKDLSFSKTVHRRGIRGASLKSLFTFIKIAQYTLIAVNVLIVFVNLTDVVTLITENYPEGIAPSDYLHDGFYSLVFSIVLAIGLILLFFGGSLNFIKQHPQLLLTAKIWIQLNFILTLTTGYKIAHYIFNYGLTYNRILISVFLLTVAIGLIISWIKIDNKYNNSFLLRTAFASAVFVLMGTAILPWNTVITSYNLSKDFTAIDAQYLYELKDNSRILEDYVNTDNKLFSEKQVELIHTKYKREQIAYKMLGWQSWNLVDAFNTQPLEHNSYSTTFSR